MGDLAIVGRAFTSELQPHLPDWGRRANGLPRPVKRESSQNALAPRIRLRPYTGGMKVIAGAIAALFTVGGSVAQDLDVVSNSGLVSVEWDSVPGVAYRLQNNADLVSGWTNVEGGAWSYGLGQRFSYGVYAFDQGGTPTIPDPPSSTHTFAITVFASEGKTLVSWQGHNGGQALIDSSQLPASLPPALALQVPDGQGGFYALTIVQVSVT